MRTRKFILCMQKLPKDSSIGKWRFWRIFQNCAINLSKKNALKLNHPHSHFHPPQTPANAIPITTKRSTKTTHQTTPHFAPDLD